MLPTTRIIHDAPPPLLLLLSARSSPESARPEEEEDIAPIRDKRLRILVVDDMRRFRESTRALLEVKYAAEVTDVGSGPEAVGVLGAGGEFDLVLLDIVMQPMNGIQTCKELRQLDPGCLVVMMTGYAAPEDWDEARKLGVDLIHKPIDEKVLNTILRKVERR